MKKAAIILLLSFLLILIVLHFAPPQNCAQPAGISLDTSRSWFSDFMEIDDMAYSRCGLTVINQTGAKAYVRVTSDASLYDRWNLYAKKELTGYTMDMKTDVFPLEAGENKLLVYFGAPFGGRFQRFNRSLPWNIQLYTVDNTDPVIDCVAEERAYGGLLLHMFDKSEKGNGSVAYDFDRDGVDETISISKDEDINYAFQFKDGDELKDELVIRSLTPLKSILLHDFKFPDGSLELIVCWEGPFTMSYKGTETTDMDYDTCLIRVCDGELIPDLGEIYGSGGYHERAEYYNGRLFSIAGNRVTLENIDAPIRIDLSDGRETPGAY